MAMLIHTVPHCIVQFFDKTVLFSNKMNIQLLTFAYIRLLNKQYENEVTLTGQNDTLNAISLLKFCHTLLKIRSL